ncbi:hypothetical protein N0V90_002183 [Kalmusia sp. IMI 367209]|nr:hypothetical protein N0V90_002183 [Kalmusia sp. IMI 367209]
MAHSGKKTTWQLAEVHSPHLPGSVEAIVAKDIPYAADPNRLQTLNLYLAHTPSTKELPGTPVESLPATIKDSLGVPNWQIHIHGGAWRDPDLNASSIEAAVAHALSALYVGDGRGIFGIASLNYTVSPFPSVPDWLPTKAYDPKLAKHSDPAREARHPQHLHDVFSAFALLRSLGLSDGSFVLTGHSAGACLALQSTLQSPAYFGLDIQAIPRPAAIAGLNGLYDLPGLVHDLGATHAQLSDEYARILGQAFGCDEELWMQASPEGFDIAGIAERVERGEAPKLILLDQSTEDQLVPMSQMKRMKAKLEQVKGLKVVEGKRCRGTHAAPWEEGVMIWDTVRDVLALLNKGR